MMRSSCGEISGIVEFSTAIVPLMITWNVVAYRDECEAGFEKSHRNRDLMVRVSSCLLELGNSVAATSMDLRSS